MKSPGLELGLGPTFLNLKIYNFPFLLIFKLFKNHFQFDVPTQAADFFNKLKSWTSHFILFTYLVCSIYTV